MRVLPKLLVLLLASGGLSFVSVEIGWAQDSSSPSSVVEPELSGADLAGKASYEANCQSCHGADLTGTRKGPTFLTRVYHPGHHADGSFALAVKRGARQHHFRFGDMPALPKISDEDIANIVAYVRAVQKANGLF